MTKKTETNDKNIKKGEYSEISLFRNPFLTIKTLIEILSVQFVRFMRFLISHKIFLFLLLGYLGLNMFNGPHKIVNNCLLINL